MLYTVAEVAQLIGVSKVSIYNKLKLKEIEEYIVKSKGITYVTDDGLNLIKEGFNIINGVESDLTHSEIASDEMLETECIDEGFNLKDDYVNYLKEENQRLWSEIDEKNIQLNGKDKLLENMQILIKREQELKQFQWENHFKEVDIKLGEIKENMAKKKTKRTWFDKIKKSD